MYGKQGLRFHFKLKYQIIICWIFFKDITNASNDKTGKVTNDKFNKGLKRQKCGFNEIKYFNGICMIPPGWK